MKTDGVPVSFTAFSYLQSDCFRRNCNATTTQRKYKKNNEGMHAVTDLAGLCLIVPFSRK